MTIKEIQKRHKIKTNDLEEIKKILKKKIKENHPDNVANTDIEYFTELKEDIDFIENMSKKQEISIPINELSQALAEIIKLQNQNEVAQIKKLNIKLDESVKNQVEINKGYRKVSRYSLTGISAVITFLWMFPNQVLEHPMVQMFINSEWKKQQFISILSCIWLVSLMIALAYWIFTFINERRENELLEDIKMERMQNRIFMNFLSENENINKFYKEQFISYLYFYFRNEERYRAKFISEELIQNVADIILMRAVEQGIIRTIKTKKLTDCYEIVNEDD